MINIRYHIVSITAVFLALGIGIALGSTFLDGATVDVLNRNIADAENRIRDSKDRIDELEQERDDATERDDALVLFGTDRLLAGSLEDQRVLVIAEPGVGDDELDALRSVVARSGADLRGTLALGDRLASDDQVDADAAAALGLPDPSPAELRAAVVTSLRGALAEAGAPADDTGSGDDGETTTTTEPDADAPTTTIPGEAPDVDGTQPAIVTMLLDRDLASFEPGPDHEDGEPILEEPGYRYLFVGAADPEPADTDLTLSLLAGAEGDEVLPAVAVTSTQAVPQDGEELAPTLVRRIREDDALAEGYTTVDDIDTFAGLAATVFSVADLGLMEPGHYGQSDGASAVLPPTP